MKKHNRGRALALFLALVLMTGIFAACGESKNADSDTPKEEGAAVTPSAEGGEETEEETTYWEAVAKPDLGGIEMNAGTDYFDSNFYNVLDWEETSGDGLKDAMYTRNRGVEDALNCKFVVTYGNPSGQLEQSVYSGMGDVDFVYSLISGGGNLVQKGYLTPFNELDNIDMTQPYWDQGAQRYLKILGQMYFGFVDFGFDHYDSLAVLFYNGALLNNYHIEDPQELVLEGKWTIDKFSEQLDAVLTDVNGDGKYTMKDDVLGLTGREYWFQPFQYGSGVQLVTWDNAEEKFMLHMMDDNFLAVSEAIGKIYNKNNPAVDYSDYDAGRIAFSDGRSLYYSRLLGDFRQLREVEDDYGVVCFPRYAEENEDCAYFVKNPTTLFLPLVVGDDNGDGVQDFAEIGSFLEAMGAYTLSDTLNVYLETTVIGKGMRDQKSAEMVRLMMKNRCFDLCEAFSLHSVLDAYLGAVINEGTYASSAKKVEKLFSKLTEKITTEIEEHIAQG